MSSRGPRRRDHELDPVGGAAAGSGRDGDKDENAGFRQTLVCQQRFCRPLSVLRRDSQTLVIRSRRDANPLQGIDNELGRSRYFAAILFHDQRAGPGGDWPGAFPFTRVQRLAPGENECSEREDRDGSSPHEYAAVAAAAGPRAIITCGCSPPNFGRARDVLWPTKPEKFVGWTDER